ncbi:helix-turn-helix domain-containing protein [Amycolatopsis cihanbeyliensis]|nr:XRE family transcriptional regulator [Amycolatopsis cihanbeyliensis]
MDMAQVVGGNVQRLRSAAGISLADLAAAGGISKTTLHGIEQGQGNPTLSTLWALATALHVPLGDLLEAPAAPAEVVRAADERPYARGAAVGARMLHRIPVHGTVEVYEVEIDQAGQDSAAHLPGVQECLVLTSGRITTGPADAPAELAAGDSIRFDGAHPHVYRGHGGHNRGILLMLYTER